MEQHTAIFIPTLLFWENGNTWYGSLGQARFFLQPVKQETPEEGQPDTVLEAELWRGPLTKALSEIIATASFPLSEEGLASAAAWLEEQAAVLNQP
ncbi:MAG: hypothetical protein HFF50_01485 [Lawsonibacter sp.]|nr:hypothetical protein [Lawsonibacter sp.]